MLDQLLNLVKQQAGEAIINNPEVPNEKNDAVVNEATNSILGGLQNVIGQKGGVQNLLSMFTGNGSSASSGVSSMVTNMVTQNLMKKFGFNTGAANGIAGGLVSNVLNNLVHKTNDPNDSSFDIQGIFNHLTGGKTQNTNVQGVLDKAKGGMLDLNGDGQTDLNDLLSVIGNSGSGGGGGILGTLKGLFGK